MSDVKSYKVLFYTALVTILTASSPSAQPVSPPEASSKTVAEEICTVCHKADEIEGVNRECSVWMKHGHPVYVTPSGQVRIPKKFPLNKGQLYCGTCHVVGTNQTEGEKTPYLYSNKLPLRFENHSSSLCLECHPQMKIDGASVSPTGLDFIVTGTTTTEGGRKEYADKSSFVYNHPMNQKTGRIPKQLLEAGGSFGRSKDTIICETCHIIHQAQDDKLLVLNAQELCGFCHSEMEAHDREKASLRGTHPVNILPSLAPVDVKVLESGGKLGPQGDIVCLTCHKLHLSKNKNSLLVEGNQQSAFCIRCHEKQANDIKGTKHDLRLIAANEKNIQGQKPEETGLCGGCHLPHKGQGAKMWAKEIFDKQTDTVTQLCNSCHWAEGCASGKKTGEFSHPVGVEMQRISAARSNFPLFDSSGTLKGRGEVTCATCHNVHRWDSGSADKGDLKQNGTNKNSFLRARNVDSELCRDCHSDKWRIMGTSHDPLAKLYENFPVMKDKAGAPLGLCDQCHSVHNAASVSLWQRPLGKGEDEMSQICSSCHSDKQVASSRLLGKFSHPVGNSILELGRRLKATLPVFDDMMRYDPKGKVFCNSCHDTHQWDPNKDKPGTYTKVKGDVSNSFLRKSPLNDKDELCSGCHQEEKWIQGTDHDLRITAVDEKNANGLTIKQSGICLSCHAVHNAADGYFLWNKELGAGKDPVTQRCNSCHSEGKSAAKKLTGFSHPVGGKMDKDLDLPHFPTYDDDMKRVDGGGKMLCSTCHNTHKWEPEPKKAANENLEGTNRNSFLRISIEKGQALCLECHQEKITVEGTAHDLSVSAPGAKNHLGQAADKNEICGSCHVVHNAAASAKLWARKPGAAQNAISQLCNSCHAPGECASKKMVTNSHVVGVGIYGAGGKTSLPLYDKQGLRADKGLVTCATCHDSHQWNPQQAVKGDGKLIEGTEKTSFLRLTDSTNSELCFDCHKDKQTIVNTPHNLALNRPNEKNIRGETPAQSGICRTCHLVHNGSLPAMLWAKNPGTTNKIRNWDESLITSPDIGAALCTGCHSPQGTASDKIPRFALHPDNSFIIQKEVKSFGLPLIPEPFAYAYAAGNILVAAASLEQGFLPKFPLLNKDGAVTAAGNITCSTCHDSHQLSPQGLKLRSDPLQRGGIANNFLRPGIVNGLCSDCHGNKSYFLYAYFHRSRPKLPIAETTVHLTYKGCIFCHETPPERDKFTKLKISGDINKLCTSCHEGQKLSGEVHPVGLAMLTGKIKLPLFKGEVACTTCHDLKGHQIASGNQKLTNPTFLRIAQSSELVAIGPRSGQVKTGYPNDRLALCAECHGEGNPRFNPHLQQVGANKVVNEQMCFLCHTSVSKEQPIAGDDAQLRAPIEKHCIGCHADKLKQHPANVDHFGKALSPITLSMLKMSMRVDIKSIPLAEGKLVCPTCHNPHQKGAPLYQYSQNKDKGEIREKLSGFGSCALCHRKGGGPANIGAPF
ncbi:MAG: hypothetical protein HZA78_13305 [Candidatus Schekmanbacteria bacterium]|nr:hypothetical protein [Candidatus Schekmanbacteria bacterium]